MHFIHLADVHLGAAPDRGSAWSRQREEEIWETFRRIIGIIRDDPVEFLFISGDLFHRQPLMREQKEVNYLFSSIPDTKVYIIAGNHDHLLPGSALLKGEWADNVTFFSHQKVEAIQDKDYPVTVYGLSYEAREIKEPLYDDLRPISSEGYHILLAHGGDATHIPIDKKRLVRAGFDYVALGHIHKPASIFRNKMAYAGSLEPLDATELGRHGYILGSMEDGHVQIEFKPFSKRIYRFLEIPLDPDSTQSSLRDRIRDQIDKYGSHNIYKFVLTGERSSDALIFTQRLMDLGNIIEIRDQSRVSYDFDMLKIRYRGTLIGDYIEHFSDRKLSEIEKKALEYGVSALLGAEALNRQ